MNDITALMQRLKLAAAKGCCQTLLPDDCRALVEALEARDKKIDAEICRANREHHRGFMMACGHLKEHANVHYADAAEMEIAALRQRNADLVEALEKAQRNENLTEAERQAYLGLIRDRDARIAELEKAASEPVAWTNEESLSGVVIDMCGMLGPKNAVGDIALYTVSPSLESRTVTVKLPKAISVLHRRDFNDAHRSIYAYPEAELNAALAAAGIQVIEGVQKNG